MNVASQYSNSDNDRVFVMIFSRETVAAKLDWTVG